MKQFIQREFLILSVWVKLIFRDPKKYLTVATSTYVIGATRMCIAAKPAYFFCRIIDDCVDGDLEPKLFGYPSIKEQLVRLKKVLENPNLANKPLEFLLLDFKRKAPVQCETNIVDFLNAMLVEYIRRKEKKIFTKSELIDIHLKSFFPVLEIAFLSLETDYSMDLLMELALIQSLVYSIQDLDSDLKKGIVNLPKELMDTMNISLIELQKEPIILWNQKSFTMWVHDCLIQAKQKSECILETKLSPKATRLISILVNPILVDIETILMDMASKHYAFKQEVE